MLPCSSSKPRFNTFSYPNLERERERECLWWRKCDREDHRQWCRRRMVRRLRSERVRFIADFFKSLPILAPLSLNPNPNHQPLSLPKSKPPHLNLTFSKPRLKPYPKNDHLNLKRKRNKRKQRGRERSFSVWPEREREIGKWKMSLHRVWVLCLIDKKI